MINFLPTQIVFLESRPNDQDTATLMASGADGWVRAWSIHHKGGLLGQFNAAQKGGGESVLAMTTDSKNEFLITGDTSGYIMVSLLLLQWSFIRRE